MFGESAESSGRIPSETAIPWGQIVIPLSYASPAYAALEVFVTLAPTAARTVPLGGTETEVASIAAGMMRISDSPDSAIRELYTAARESGITFFDHADIYGHHRHHCEQRFGQALGLSPAEREGIILQTKTGILTEGPSYDSSYAHIVASAEASLRALNTEYLDVLLIHRPDALVEPEEVARAFDHLESSGKVRHFGVSNHTVGQIQLLRSAVNQPLVANQAQLSLTHAGLISQGMTANMGATGVPTGDDAGLLDYCRAHRLTLQAWSPFQKGTSPGVIFGAPEYPELNAELDRLAAEYGVTPMAIATAWLTRHPAQMQVVVGTTSPDRLKEAAIGSQIRLTRPQWYGLFRAAGHLVP